MKRLYARWTPRFLSLVAHSAYDTTCELKELRHEPTAFETDLALCLRAGKRFFGGLEVLLHRTDIALLEVEARYSKCIMLEGVYVEEKYVMNPAKMA